jgi:uncharacterized delta-60 repeat protein
MRKIYCFLLLLLPGMIQAQALIRDTTFGMNGAVVYTEDGRSSVAHDLICTPDGKILAAGMEYAQDGNLYYRSFVAKYHADGRIDSSFGNNGTIVLETNHKNAAQALALQADGKLVVAGNETIIIEQPPGATIIARPFIARFMPDGSRDSLFGNNGVHELSILDGYVDKELAAIAVLPDNRIVAGGSVQQAALSQMMLLCLLPDGTYDYNFANSGIGTYTMEQGQSAVLWDMLVQDDGQILIAGASGNNNLIQLPDSRFAMSRIQSDGSMDVQFGTQGITVTQISNTQVKADVATGITRLSNGNIILAGGSAGVLALAGYDSNGHTDAGFGTGGIINYQDHPISSGVVSNGQQIFSCGAIARENGDLDYSISAFLPNGAIDSGSTPEGILRMAVYQRNYQHALAMQADGKIVTGGSFRDTSNLQGMLLLRLGSATDPISVMEYNTPLSSVNIYPNPATDHIVLDWGTSPGRTHPQMRMLNMMGQEVYRTEIKQQRTSLPLPNIGAGMYMIQLQDEVHTRVLKLLKK